MAELERIGISLDQGLLSEFDALIAKKNYPNRSEAIRDLIRDELSQEQLGNPDSYAVATVCLVYDHHSPQLTHKIMALQHNRYLKTISTMHVHLDSDDCLEVIVLKGQVAEITKLGESLISLKGVKLGKINLMALDESPHEHRHGEHDHHTHEHGGHGNDSR